MISPGCAPTACWKQTVLVMLLSAMLAEGLENDAPGLEGKDASAGADLFGKEHRVRADVGADLHDDLAGADDLLEEHDLAFGELAVQIERAADVHVVDVEQKLPMPADFESIERFEAGHRRFSDRIRLLRSASRADQLDRAAGKVSNGGVSGITASRRVYPAGSLELRPANPPARIRLAFGSHSALHWRQILISMLKIRCMITSRKSVNCDSWPSRGTVP